ncbi:hypothetical protein [Novosphingobium sp. B 225]|uniref:hypothetical protein n=1 Tax=Novosphingobium sp. B 225 TaxID=1961849 RepID=UPI000B4BF09F|nr:hypothetical protein [Novosphingobium sp. B 225]
MISAADVAGCQWLEPGGVQAAQTICAFLQDIGIAVRIEPVSGDMFLPGIDVHQGAVRIDPARAAYPGDLLHEAGHLAVIEAERRSGTSAVEADPGEEMAAMAWSVAAATHCGLPLEVVFHPDGYKGGSAEMISAFSGPMGPGVPLLSAWGMSAEPHRAAEWGRDPFPAMTRWLR